LNKLSEARKTIRWLAIGGIVLFLAGSGLASRQKKTFLQGVVTVVYDGDTVRVKLSSGIERKVRLLGIDTPEMGDEHEEVRYRAFLAKRFAFFHLFRKSVALERDWELEDEYGRILAYVWWDNKMFNEFILREGFAVPFLKYPFRQDYRRRFIAARNQAKRENAGYWMSTPYPEISLNQLQKYLGKLVSVRFSCRTRKRGRNLFLSDGGSRFSALVPLKIASDFHDLEASDGRVVRISGFLEEYRGKPQIMLAFPRQLEIVP